MQIKYTFGDYNTSIRSLFAQTNPQTQGDSEYFSPDCSKLSPLSIHSGDEEEEGSMILNGSKKIQKMRQDKLSNSNVKSAPKNKKPKFKKDPWTTEEDAQLLSLMEKHGNKWTLIGSIMGKRTGKQVRDRYLNNLRPDIKNNDWTEEEDLLFLSLIQKIGKKWCKIATLIPGRTESQVKNHFHAQIMKQMPEKVQEILNNKANFDDCSNESRLINVIQKEDESQSHAVSYDQGSSFIDPQDFLCRWNDSIENQSQTNAKLVSSPSLYKSSFEELFQERLY